MSLAFWGRKGLAVHPVLASLGQFSKCTATRKKPSFGVAYREAWAVPESLLDSVRRSAVS